MPDRPSKEPPVADPAEAIRVLIAVAVDKVPVGVLFNANKALAELEARKGLGSAWPLAATHHPADRPDRLWWCNSCPGPVCHWGSNRPPPRCPECHESNFWPVSWIPDAAQPRMLTGAD